MDSEAGAPPVENAARAESSDEDDEDGGLDTLTETSVYDPESGKRPFRFISNVAIGKFKAADAETKVVILARAQLRACYERTIAEQPEASGKLLLTLDIDAIGTVSHVKTEAKGKLPASMELCIQRRGLSWKFAEIDAGTRTLRVPLTFTQKKLP